MSKIFSTQFHNNSLIEEVSGLPLIYNGKLITTSKGFSFPFNLPTSSPGYRAKIADFDWTQLNNGGSIVIGFNSLNRFVAQTGILSNNKDAATPTNNTIEVWASQTPHAYYTFRIKSNNILKTGNYENVNITSKNNAVLIFINDSVNQVASLYQNNELIASTSYTGNLFDTFTGSDNVMYRSVYNTGNNAISFINIFNHQLSQSEIDAEYSLFKSLQPVKLESPYYKLKLPPSPIVGNVLCTYNFDKITPTNLEGNNLPMINNNQGKLPNGTGIELISKAFNSYYINQNHDFSGQSSFILVFKGRKLSNNYAGLIGFAGINLHIGQYAGQNILSLFNLGGTGQNNRIDSSIDSRSGLLIVMGTIDGANGAKKLYINGQLVGTDNSNWDLSALTNCKPQFGNVPSGGGTNNFGSILYHGIIAQRIISQDEYLKVYNFIAQQTYLKLDLSQISVGTKHPIFFEKTGRYQVVEAKSQINQNEIIVTNAGGPNTTDWIDSNSDGLADSWNLTYSTDTATPSIITGNGFIGNAQRAEYTNYSSVAINSPSTILKLNTYYKISFKYRASKLLYIYKAQNEILTTTPANTGNALYFEAIVYPNYLTSGALNIYVNSASIGDFFEIDEVQVLPILSPSMYMYQCKTAGITSVPSEQAYGTWNFKLLKVSTTTNNSDIYFISSKPTSNNNSNQGYMLRYNGTDSKFYLYRVNNTTLTQLGVSNAFSIAVEHAIKITRDVTGAFIVYIDGSSAITVTDNTYSICNSFVLSLQVGDYIAPELDNSLIKYGS